MAPNRQLITIMRQCLAADEEVIAAAGSSSPEPAPRSVASSGPAAGVARSAATTPDDPPAYRDQLAALRQLGAAVGDAQVLALGGGEGFMLAAALPRAADLGGVLDCGRFAADPGQRVRLTGNGQCPLTGPAWDHFRQ